VTGRVADGAGPAASEGQRRVHLLLEADRLLRASLDHEAALAALAELLARHAAAWCTVDLLEPNGRLRRVAAAHRNPAAGGRLRAWVGAWIADGAGWVPARVAARRRLLTLPALDDPVAVAPSGRPEDTATARSLGFGPTASVPLRRPDETLGALTCVGVDRYRPSELALLQTIAGRAADAVWRGRQYRAAEAASRAKDEFLAMLGHELRNPVAAIRDSVRGLERIGRPDGPAVELRSIIARQAGHLARLVDDLLDLQAIEAGRLLLQPEPVDLAALAERCVATLRATGQTARHDVRVDAEPARVRGDPVRLEQVCANLLDNALKHTPAGGRIAVTVRAERGDALLRVADTGRGIPAEVLPHVFELFAQGAQPLDRPRGGLGLGLTLVHRLVELHGGTVTAQSPGPDGGATFEVRLPADAEAGPEPPAPPAAAVGEVPAGGILLVEDNDDVREALRLWLENEGHRVAVAASGPAAVEAAARVRPDLVLIDIGLPGLDGYEVARRLRADAATRGAFLAALTGYGEPEARRRAAEAGFDAHLVKPVDESKLARLLAQAAAARSRRAG